MFRVSLVTALTLSASAAFAVTEAQRERAITAFAEIESRMHAFYIAASPDFESVLVSMAGDPAMEEVMDCTLRRIEDAGGSALVEEYLSGLEIQASREIKSISAMSDDLPEVMTGDVAMDAALNCGGAELMQEKQMTDAFQEVLSRPEVMQRLIGE